MRGFEKAGTTIVIMYRQIQVKLGMSDNSTAFEAKQNQEIGQGYWDIYNYTGSNPDTNFVSKDAVAEQVII